MVWPRDTRRLIIQAEAEAQVSGVIELCSSSLTSGNDATHEDLALSSVKPKTTTDSYTHLCMHYYVSYFVSFPFRFVSIPGFITCHNDRLKDVT